MWLLRMSGGVPVKMWLTDQVTGVETVRPRRGDDDIQDDLLGYLAGRCGPTSLCVMGGVDSLFGGPNTELLVGGPERGRPISILELAIRSTRPAGAGSKNE